MPPSIGFNNKHNVNIRCEVKFLGGSKSNFHDVLSGKFSHFKGKIDTLPKKKTHLFLKLLQKFWL